MYEFYSGTNLKCMQCLPGTFQIPSNSYINYMFLNLCFNVFQISFTIKELREMTKLPGCRSNFEPEDFKPIREKLSGNDWRRTLHYVTLHYVALRYVA